MSRIERSVQHWYVDHMNVFQSPDHPPLGILPRNGRNIKFTEFAKILETTYNLSPSLCMGILMSIARLFQRDVSLF